MICIARTFGAPLTVPAGKQARMSSTESTPGLSLPTTLLTMCMTWLYRSIVIKSCTSTVPNSHTLPKSFLPRSTSMMCSARSFSSESRSSSRRLSWATVAPLGLVPAIGRTLAWFPSSPTRISGEAPTMSISSKRR